jgi:hypothetical protein
LDTSGQIVKIVTSGQVGKTKPSLRNAIRGSEVTSGRKLIYQLVNAAFQSAQIKPSAAELGVLKGENAEMIFRELSPVQFYLIDSWSKDAFLDYKENNKHRPWVDDIDDYAKYFGGSLDAQSTFDKLFAEAVQKFKDKKTVSVMRYSSRDALPHLQKMLGEKNKLDYIYVDASHQYETVLDDLIEYQQFLQPNGLFQLNDCCHSAQGVKQNLGVLEATVKFCKMAEFVPVLLTNTDFTDVVLARKSSPMLETIDQVILSNRVDFVEVPDQLFGALKVRSGKRDNLSFV